MVLAYPTWWYAMPAILKVILIREEEGPGLAVFVLSVPLHIPDILYLICPPLANPTTNPAMNNKGWIERTFLPHAAFTLPGPGSPPPSVVGLVPQLQNITYVYFLFLWVMIRVG